MQILTTIHAYNFVVKMYFINMQKVADYIATNETEIKIRRGKKTDCKEIARLIQELADFEKMPEGPELNHKILEQDGFVRDPPLFYLFVAEKPQEDQPKFRDELVAYGLYYYKYSTWKGKAMVLEDLYCTPQYRKKHVGSALFKAVVREAVSSGCRRMDFEVLEWNPARKFYEKLGAIDITETESWHLYRMNCKALEAMESGPSF